MLLSTSDEFPTLSWWAAHESGAHELELVGEESDHRPVWGLRRGSVQVKVPYLNQELRAEVRVQGTAVGLSEAVVELTSLIFTCPPIVSMDDVMQLAKIEYKRAFRRQGLRVFYTRKYYENVQWRAFGMLPARKIESVSLDDGKEMELLADAKRFLGEQAVYDRAGRPHKRVYCLYGPPGTGKTSTVMAIASELAKDLAIFNVDSLRDDTFIELMSSLPEGAVVMFEDVDAMFKQRESRAGGMTFSTLLNSLDGVLHPRGTLIFLTTNHVERLDEALHRPGRVDRLVEVGNSNASQRALMWKAVFPRRDPPAVLLRETPNISPAWLSALLFQHRMDSPGDVDAALVAAMRRPLTAKPKPKPKPERKVKQG